MEKSISQSLQRKVDDFSGNTQMQNQIKQQIQTSENQAKELHKRIVELGGSVGGGVADIPNRIAGAIADIQDSIVGSGGDAVVKDTIADYASDSLEIATYEAISSAANAVGDKETAQLANSLLVQEKKEAQMAEKQIPSISSDYIKSLK